MSTHDLPSTRLSVLTSILVLGLAVAGCASNASDHYRFDVVDQPIAASAHSTITVRLIDTTTGQPVDGATISNAHLRMRMTNDVPPGKGIWLERYHPEAIRFVGSTGFGQYTLVADVSMPGTWTLHLAANVPGEASQVEGSTTFVAGPERHDR